MKEDGVVNLESENEINTPNQIPLKHRMEEMQPTSKTIIPEVVTFIQSSKVTER